jgi:hypothetical protein
MRQVKMKVMPVRLLQLEVNKDNFRRVSSATLQLTAILATNILLRKIHVLA